MRFHEQPDEPEDTPTDSRDTDIMILNDGEEQTEKDEQSDSERPTQVDVETVEPRRSSLLMSPPLSKILTKVMRKESGGWL